MPPHVQREARLVARTSAPAVDLVPAQHAAYIFWHRDGDARQPHCPAKSLPAWMQLLHPFATFIAKSKLLVLPVYPAAWPQAKEHPIVQRFFQFCGYCMSLDILRRARYRIPTDGTRRRRGGQ